MTNYAINAHPDKTIQNNDILGRLEHHIDNDLSKTWCGRHITARILNGIASLVVAPLNALDMTLRMPIQIAGYFAVKPVVHVAAYIAQSDKISAFEAKNLPTPCSIKTTFIRIITSMISIITRAFGVLFPSLFQKQLNEEAIIHKATSIELEAAIAAKNQEEEIEALNELLQESELADSSTESKETSDVAELDVEENSADDQFLNFFTDADSIDDPEEIEEDEYASTANEGKTAVSEEGATKSSYARKAGIAAVAGAAGCGVIAITNLIAPDLFPGIKTSLIG